MWWCGSERKRCYDAMTEEVKGSPEELKVDMKDYRYLKSQIDFIPAGREAELDELIQDAELMSMIERMCARSNASLPIYLQFLMEQEAPGNLRLHELAKVLVVHAMKSRPEIFRE